jgi:hypothetical protein
MLQRDHAAAVLSTALGRPPSCFLSTGPFARHAPATFSTGDVRHSAASSFAPVSSFASTSLPPFKQQVDVALKTHVESVCFKCFRCFRGILQVFRIDVAKVYRDVEYVAIVCSHVSSVYRTYVASVFI